MSQAPEVRNILDHIGPFRDGEGERFESLLETEALKLERIVSRGHATPPGEWFDQDRDEWVLVLRGRAALTIEGRAEPIVVGPCDYLHLPAHTRHRVEWTDPNHDTVWLALHHAQ